MPQVTNLNLEVTASRAIFYMVIKHYDKQLDHFHRCNFSKLLSQKAKNCKIQITTIQSGRYSIFNISPKTLRSGLLLDGYIADRYVTDKSHNYDSAENSTSLQHDSPSEQTDQQIIIPNLSKVLYERSSARTSKSRKHLQRDLTTSLAYITTLLFLFEVACLGIVWESQLCQAKV